MSSFVKGPKPNLPPLYAPYRFGVVEEDLFRGGFPKDRNHRFLKRLHLTTILSLTPHVDFDSLKTFCEKTGIAHIHVFVGKVKDDEIPLTFPVAAQILQIMTDPTKLPMYVHCLDGTTVTGVMVMLLRRLQMWSIPCAVAERGRFLGGGSVPAEEVEFVERFSGEFELSGIPGWLWGGQMTFKRHPTMRVKLPMPVAPPSSGASSVSSVSGMSASMTSATEGMLRLFTERTFDDLERPVGRPSLGSSLLGRIAQSPQGSVVLVDSNSGESSVRRRVVDALQTRSSVVADHMGHGTGQTSFSDKEARKLMRRQHGSNAGEQISLTLDALALEI